jgi:hypothetical protein
MADVVDAALLDIRDRRAEEGGDLDEQRQGVGAEH